MADDKGKGSAPAPGLSGLTVLVGLMLLFALWLTTNGPNKVNTLKPAVRTSSNQTSNSIGTRDSGMTTSRSGTRTTEVNKNYSQYHDYVSIQANSVSSDSANQEYITISAHNNKEPINIGGWTLRNGRDQKNYVVSGNVVKGQSVSVKIPERGVVLYNPFNPKTNIHSPITLKSGERALIFTGSFPTLGSVSINENFKINRCLGYVEDRSVGDTSGRYTFRPSMRYNCPTSRDLPDTGSLDETCNNFVRSIAPCHKPTDVYDKKLGYCLDRNCKLTSACQTFVKQNFNPTTCYQLYSSEPKFIGPEWRIYLNRTWELWDKQREVISLYDLSGRLVSERSY